MGAQVTTTNLVFLKKFAPDGQNLWSKTFAGPDKADGRGVACDSNGNVIFTGKFENRASFGSVMLNSRGGTDIFLAKCDPDGQVLWVLDLGGTYWDETGLAVVVDQSDNCIVTGYFGDTVDFGGVTLTNTSGATAGFIAKYSPTGDVLWAKALVIQGGNRSVAVALYPNGTPVICTSGSTLAKFVDRRPTITADPQPSAVTAGNAAVLGVQATSALPLTYQWLLNGQPLLYSRA